MTVIPVDFTKPPVETGFRSFDVCRIADVTYRQLDYWASTSLAEPTIRPANGSGTRRRYSDADLLRVCVVATLLRAGFALGSLRQYVPDVLATAADGVGFFAAPDVVVTVDLGALQARIAEHKQHLGAQQAATS